MTTPPQSVRRALSATPSDQTPAPPLPRALGDDAFTMEHRIANGVMLVGSLVSAAATALNPWLGLPGEVVAVTAVGTVGFAALYAWSRRRRRFMAPTVVAMTMLALGYYPFLWLTNVGLDGGVHTIGLIGLVATACLLSGWRRNAFLALFATVTASLFVAEYRGWLPLSTYGSRASRFADVFASFAIAGVALVALVTLLKTHYHREHERVVAYSAALVTSHEQLERALVEIEQLARTDPLTQLANRRQFHEQLAARMQEVERYRRPLSVALFDIDHFKSINDRYGHAGGDAVLVELARRVEGNVRSTDLAARWGGEEFVLLLPETDCEGARVAGERIRAAVASRRFAHGIEVTISLGLATHVPGDTVETLLGRADSATYRAKRNGRDQVAAA